MEANSEFLKGKLKLIQEMRGTPTKKIGNLITNRDQDISFDIGDLKGLKSRIEN
jgi:hypothetical protein